MNDDNSNDNVFQMDAARRLDFSGYDIPAHTRGTLERYILHRLAPGGFMTAVLANDLMGATGKADMININCLRDICGWIYMNAPGDCWGSYEQVRKYLERPSN
jgi:hypothetical protein